MEEILAQEYLRELHVVRQVSRHTIDAYEKDLKILIEKLQESQTGLTKLRSDQVRSWVGRLHAQGRAPRSIARTLSAWRGFYLWLANQKKLIAHNPLDDIKAPKRVKPLPKALSVEGAINLVESAAKHDLQEDVFLRSRNKAIFELLYSSGLRLSELLGIDLAPIQSKDYQSSGWIDFDAGEVMVLGKGGKRRTVPVGTAALRAIQEWVNVRGAQTSKNLQRGPQEIQPLFINKQGKRVSSRTVQKHLAELAVKAGLPTHVHPHMLRHSFASHVLQSSGDLRAVQEMLGHASITSTQIYTALDFQHLAQAYDHAHPRAKSKKRES
ncbi:tyrosine recombinase XerC [Polynucleobacter sp. 30F-ANTBAC]|jgi:integrase/recombinase XerC|uniref:tyrosine recombinase XerC n=1 Tax=Polynucleobacter sp. 30F-ANTBAC TaxID=2689095 RepID=UPI001C0E4D38|nr:tyrosine recombinase XerC [Polynucleobacter sp. 30F-ANTBAC]MBU3600065.1 tyrosine recombinase XerC [Polynucleobacter sp. 30F-ANTBAC]